MENKLNVTTSVLAIYRPPYSESHKVNVKTFCEEFTDFLTDIIASENNLIVMGDFNIHMNKLEDSNAIVLTEMTESLGLTQHVTQATHRAGNILDLVFTENDGDIRVVCCRNIDYISDHCAIQCNFNIPKENMTRKTIKYRKFKDINLDELQNSLIFDFADIHDVNKLVAEFELRASESINKLAPDR